jgi:hypothetical protein
MECIECEGTALAHYQDMLSSSNLDLGFITVIWFKKTVFVKIASWVPIKDVIGICAHKLF